MMQRRAFLQALGVLFAGSQIPATILPQLPPIVPPPVPVFDWTTYNHVELAERAGAVVLRVNGIDVTHCPEIVARIAKIVHVGDDAVRFSGPGGDAAMSGFWFQLPEPMEAYTVGFSVKMNEDGGGVVDRLMFDDIYLGVDEEQPFTGQLFANDCGPLCIESCLARATEEFCFGTGDEE